MSFANEIDLSIERGAVFALVDWVAF